MVNKLEILSKIDDREVEMVREDHYVKFIYQRNRKRGGGQVYISAGEETDLGEILQSVFAVIYTVFHGLKQNASGTGDDADWLRRKIIEQLNSDEFWEDDGGHMDLYPREDFGRNRNKFS